MVHQYRHFQITKPRKFRNRRKLKSLFVARKFFPPHNIHVTINNELATKGSKSKLKKEKKSLLNQEDNEIHGLHDEEFLALKNYFLSYIQNWELAVKRNGTPPCSHPKFLKVSDLDWLQKAVNKTSGIFRHFDFFLSNGCKSNIGDLQQKEEREEEDREEEFDYEYIDEDKVEVGDEEDEVNSVFAMYPNHPDHFMFDREKQTETYRKSNSSNNGTGYYKIKRSQSLY
jgi:hypothetical protein